MLSLDTHPNLEDSSVKGRKKKLILSPPWVWPANLLGSHGTDGETQAPSRSCEELETLQGLKLYLLAQDGPHPHGVQSHSIQESGWGGRHLPSNPAGQGPCPH